MILRTRRSPPLPVDDDPEMIDACSSANTNVSPAVMLNVPPAVAMPTPDEMVNEPLESILPSSSSMVTAPFLAGSRILVNYKGMQYKASIHKFRAKDEKKEVQIHYDGNRKTTLSWITVDNIYKCLENNMKHGAEQHKNKVNL